MAWFDFLNPVFNPLLALGPFWAVLIISILISFIITIVYKYATNQIIMKQLKDEQKESQQKMKTLKDNPQEMMKIQKEAMKKNFEYMKHSFKSTLITFLPIILIFGWMNAHLTYEPIYPGEAYSITASFAKGANGKIELIPDQNTQLISEAKQDISSQVTWKLKSNTEGPHSLELKQGNQSYSQKVLITKELNYETPIQFIQHSDLTQIQTNHNKLKPLGQDFNLFGWYPGWLGLYIIFSIIFSMVLRKILKVY